MFHAEEKNLVMLANKPRNNTCSGWTKKYFQDFGWMAKQGKKTKNPSDAFRWMSIHCICVPFLSERRKKHPLPSKRGKLPANALVVDYLRKHDEKSIIGNTAIKESRDLSWSP